jgi:hypothetical protein
MFRFFRNVLEAAKTERILKYLGVDVKMQCGCVHDHKYKQCQTPEESCHYGTYLIVPESYDWALVNIAEQVERIMIIQESENCGVPPLKDIGGRCF